MRLDSPKMNIMYKVCMKASKSLIKPKGISVFYFDDTLAKTKEKVNINVDYVWPTIFSR